MNAWSDSFNKQFQRRASAIVQCLIIWVNLSSLDPTASANASCPLTMIHHAFSDHCTSMICNEQLRNNLFSFHKCFNIPLKQQVLTSNFTLSRVSLSQAVDSQQLWLDVYKFNSPRQHWKILKLLFSLRGNKEYLRIEFWGDFLFLRENSWQEQ